VILYLKPQTQQKYKQFALVEILEMLARFVSAGELAADLE
jgi:hypothetical protein